MPPIGSTLSLDISGFRDNLAKAQVQITGFQRTTTQLQTSLKGLANSYSGANLIRQAELTSKAITQIGGVAKLSSEEIRKASLTLESYAAKMKALGQTIPAEIAKIRTELNKAGGSGGLFSGLSSGALAGGLAGGVAGVAASAAQSVIAGIKQRVGEVLADAGQLTKLSVPFERLSGGASAASDKLASLREATQGLVRDQSLMKAANEASVLGLDRAGIKFEEVARVATVLGRAVGQDTVQSVSDLTNGLAKNSPELLNNLGIIVRAEDAYKTYGARIGKSADQLSDLEKQQAVATIAMEKARDAAQALGDIDLTAWDRIDILTNRLYDLAAGIAAVIADSPVMNSFLGNVIGGLEYIAKWAGLSPSQKLAGVAGLGTLTGAGSQQVSQGFTTGYSTPRQSGYGDASVQNAMRDAEARIAALRPGAAAAGTSLRLRDEAARAQQESAAAAAAAAKAEAEGKRREAEAKRKAAEAKRKAEEAQRRFVEENTRAINDLFGTTSSYQPRITFQSGLGGVTAAMLGGATGLRPMGGVPAMGLPLGASIGGAIQTSGILRDSSLFMRDAAAQKTLTNIDKISTAFAGLSTSLSQLSQITGGLGPLTQMFGSMASAFGSGSSLASFFTGGKRAGETDAEFQARLGTNGGRIGALMSALSLGQSIGGMTSNPFLAAGLGAGGGALLGASMASTLGLTAGMASGIGAVAAGGIAAYQAYKRRQQEKKALAEARQDYITTMGGLTQFQSTVERVGFSYEYFLSLFNSNKPETFRMAVQQLTQALADEQERADKLAKSLTSVAEVSGVLSRSQMAQIRNLKADNPGVADVLAFDAQQRAAAETGLARAIAGLQRQIETSDAASVIKDFGAGARGLAAGLYAAFAVAVEEGENALDVLERLQPGIETLRNLYASAGQTPGAAFQQLQSYSAIANGAQTGPALQIATGLGQALAAYQNTGLLSPELFKDLANGIGEAYKQIENLGMGGIDAARLMQPALQAIWQMIQDTPSLKDSLDPATLALIDFAEQSGIIGDKFRPALDRMVDALDRLIARMDDYIARLQEAMGLGNLPTPPTGAPGPANPSAPTSPTNNGGEYASGTGLRLRNFGAERWIKVHGREAIINEAQAEALNRRLLAASQPIAMVGGGGYGTQQITMVLDGREIGRTTLKGMPSTAAVFGVL